MLSEEISRGKLKNEKIDYDELFYFFMQKRQVTYMRFLLERSNEFNEKPEHFTKALDLGCEDMAMLFYKDFSQILSPVHTPKIIQVLINSFNRQNGMIEYKCFLVRQYIEHMKVDNVSLLVDTIDIKISENSKFNILAMASNPIKAACLLIEVLEQVSSKFDQFRVNCKAVRGKITSLVKKYIVKIDHIGEMRFLMLEKDSESRDSLDLISAYTIVEFLESNTAESVVKEIWRSPYSTGNSIFVASSNHYLLFHYWDCTLDEEVINRPYVKKNVHKMGAHPLQFVVWRYSAKSRMIVEFFTTVGIALMIHFISAQVIKEAPDVAKIMKTLFEMEKRLLASVPGSA